MKTYQTAYERTAERIARPAFDKTPRQVRDKRLFNVRVNGAIVAGGIKRDAADAYLGKRLGFVEIYLTDKAPPDERPRLRLAALPKAHDFRRGPISVGPAERAKSMARVQADRSIRIEYDAPADENCSAHGVPA
jgi:hypothetical protein